MFFILNICYHLSNSACNLDYQKRSNFLEYYYVYSGVNFGLVYDKNLNSSALYQTREKVSPKASVGLHMEF